VVASVVLVIVILLYLLYCRHGRKTPRLLQEVEDINIDNTDITNNTEDDVNNNTIDSQATVQPAQEAGTLGDQQQVVFTTPTESSQSYLSKPTIEDIITKKLQLRGDYQSVPTSERGKHNSSLVVHSYHSNLFETVA